MGGVHNPVSKPARNLSWFKIHLRAFHTLSASSMVRKAVWSDASLIMRSSRLRYLNVTTRMC